MRSSRLLVNLWLPFFCFVTAVRAEEPIPQKSRENSVDLYGDPLPEGAAHRLGTVRFRHDGRMLAVAYAPDGKTIVTGAEDQTVRRWDAVSGKELKRISAPGFSGLSSDGVLFLDVDPKDPKEKKNRTVRVRNTLTDRDVGEFEWFSRYGDLNNSGHIEAVFSKDNSTIAIGAYDAKIILLWDVKKNREIVKIPYIGLHCLALSHDGKTLYTGAKNEFYEVASGKKIKTIEHRYEYGFATVAEFSADGKRIAFGGLDGTIDLFEVDSGKQLFHLKTSGKYFGGAGNRVNALAMSPDGKTLGVGSNDWTARIIDLASGKQVRQLIGPTFGNIGDHGAIHSVAFSPDGKTLAAASNVPMLRRWEPATGREISIPEVGHRDGILSITYSRDGKFLASSSTDLTIRIWDTATGKQVRQLAGHVGSINGVAFSANGRVLVSAGGYNDETLRWWDTTTGQNLRTIKIPYAYEMGVSPDGETIATAGSDGIRLWDMKSGKAVGHLKGKAYRVIFSQDGKRVSDGSRIWDIEKNQLITEFEVASRMTLSPDWKLAIAAGEISHGGGEYTAKLWEVVTQKEILTFVKNKDWINSVACSPDGRTVAIAERVGVRLWDMATGKEISRLSSETRNWYYEIIFSPDGNSLATINSNATITIWNVPAYKSPLKSEQITPKELDELWVKLAGLDPAQAYASINRLRASPAVVVPFLKDRLQPIKAPTAERLQQLIADLNNNRFAVREKATKELEQLGELAESSLRMALNEKQTLESTERLKSILSRTTEWNGDRLRHWRAIQVLENIGTPEAIDVLKSLAVGAPASRLTQEAIASVARLTKNSGRKN